MFQFKKKEYCQNLKTGELEEIFNEDAAQEKN